MTWPFPRFPAPTAPPPRGRRPGPSTTPCLGYPPVRTAPPHPVAPPPAQGEAGGPPPPAHRGVGGAGALLRPRDWAPPPMSTSTADRIAALRAEGEAAVAAAPSTAELEDVRVRFLGRKAELPNLLRDVGKLPAAERG